MNLTNMAMDISEAINKTYAILRARPYADIKVKYPATRGSGGKADEDYLSVTIINTGFGEMEVHKVWFLTAYNRPVFSEFIDSKMPVKLAEHERVTYFTPAKELKAAFNKSAGDTIAQAVISDSSGNQFSGRLSESAQKQLTK